MRTTLSLILSLMLTFAPTGADAADREKSKTLNDAANALGGLFGSKSKKEKPPEEKQKSGKSLEEAQAEDREKGMAGGAAIGAVAGAAIKEDDRAKGAAIGAATGGVAGYIVGNEMAKKRGNYAARYDELDQAIIAAQQKIESLQTETARVERRIVLRESQIKAATARTASNQAALAAQKQALADVEVDIKANDSASQSAMVTIKVLEDEIKSIESQVKADAELASRKTQLEAKRNELLAVLQKINDTDNTLVAQRAALSGQARS